MAQFKNISGRSLEVPVLGLAARIVAPNAVITVNDADAQGYAGQSATWQAQDAGAANAVAALSNAPITAPSYIAGTTQ